MNQDKIKVGQVVKVVRDYYITPYDIDKFTPAAIDILQYHKIHVGIHGVISRISFWSDFSGPGSFEIVWMDGSVVNLTPLSPYADLIEAVDLDDA